MHIVVCLKQVPEDNMVRVEDDGSLRVVGEAALNIYDEHALEAALTLAAAHAGRVTALAVGPAGWEPMLRRALAIGADAALRCDDPAFAALDALGVAHVLAAAVRFLAPVDLALCGRASTDEASGVVGAALAQLLGWPCVGAVAAVGLLADGRVQAERQLDAVVQTVAVRLPAVLACTKGATTPRLPSLLRIKKAARASIPVASAATLGLAALPAAPDVVRRTVPPAAAAELLTGTPAEQVAALLARLRADLA